MKIKRKAASILIAMMMLISAFGGCAKNASNEKTTAALEETTTNITKIANAKVGDIVQFGRYEQDNITTDGKEKIDWRVLAVEKGKALLLSEKILDCKPYNKTDTDVTWKTCTLRSWLNNDFCNSAFSSAEQTRIKTSIIVNEDNPWNGTDGGKNTSDKLFLLSYSEVKNPVFGFSRNPDDYNTSRRAQGTDFAKSNGLYVNVNTKHSNWWLRTPGIYSNLACSVYGNGDVNSYYDIVDNTNIGVRPALWINL